MLGAQARAAELQAAKSAAMRQRAHREAEDPTRPPEAAPVSLNDFVRNPPSNKNKGTKVFRPLIESDFEVSTTLMDQQTSNSSTSSADNALARLPDTAPTAPRAMLSQSSSCTTKVTSSRATAPTFTPRSVHASGLQKALEFCDSLRPIPPPASTAANVVSRVFRPDDLSPTKQEIKLAKLRQQYGPGQATQTPAYPNATLFMPNDMTFTPHQNYHYEGHHQYPDRFTNIPFDSYMYDHSAINHYQSEHSTVATGYGPGQSQADRIQLFADDVLDHQHRMQPDSHVREPLKTASSILGNDLPYDRNSKMQSFVAAQQAMARKGKTVLHNPELHKSPLVTNMTTTRSRSYPATTPSPLQMYPNLSFLDAEETAETSYTRRTTKVEDKEAILRAILKRNTALVEHQTEPVVSRKLEEVEFTSVDKFQIANKMLFGQLVSDDWYNLRPITTKEREIMLRSVKKTAAESSIDPDVQLISASASLVGKGAREWLQNKSTHQSTRRTNVARIVGEHEKCMDHFSTYGVIGKPIFREQTDLSSRRALKAIADIMATLYDCADDKRRNPKLSQYTIAPRYAIDETVSMNLTGASLFDNLGFRVAKSVVKLYK